MPGWYLVGPIFLTSRRGCARGETPEDAMTATLCPWTDDCIPDHPLVTTVTIIMALAVIALGINDTIGKGRK